MSSVSSVNGNNVNNVNNVNNNDNNNNNNNVNNNTNNNNVNYNANSNSNANDSVQISAAAQEANNNSNSNSTSATTESAESNSKQMRLRYQRSSRYSRSDRSSRNDRGSRYNRSSKAERQSRTDTRSLRTHGTKSSQKVEKSSKQISATEKVKSRDHNLRTNKSGRYDSGMLRSKTEKLSMVFKSLSKSGASSKEVAKVVKQANKDLNQRLGKDLKQAYKDYKKKKISSEEFKSRIYEAAIKKVQGVAKALRSNFMQRPQLSVDNNESSTPSFAKKADNNGSSTLSFVKKDDGQAAPAPRTSIFAKKDKTAMSPKPIETPTVKKDEPTLAEKAMAANKEKSEEAKAEAKSEDNTAMAAKPAITEDAKITEKRENIGEDVGDHLTTTTEKTVENSALKTGNVKVKDDDDDDDDNDKKVAKVNDNAEKAVAEVDDDDDDDDDEKVAKATPGSEKQEEGALLPGLGKLEKELKNLLNEIFAEEELPPGLEKKDGLPGNADKAFEEIVGIFNDMDKMVNDLGEKEEKGLDTFVQGLKEMFKDIGSTESNSFLKNLNKVAKEHGAADAEKVGAAQIKADALSELFRVRNDDSKFGIKQVGDNGEGSGNFTAVNFMAEISGNSSNDGLESYREAKEARENAMENGENEAATESKQENAEVELSALA